MYAPKGKFGEGFCVKTCFLHLCSVCGRRILDIINSLFKSFSAMQVCSLVDRFYSEPLEKYVTETVMNIITFFFNSPFSDASTMIKVNIFEINYIKK